MQLPASITNIQLQVRSRLFGYATDLVQWLRTLRAAARRAPEPVTTGHNNADPDHPDLNLTIVPADRRVGTAHQNTAHPIGLTAHRRVSTAHQNTAYQDIDHHHVNDQLLQSAAGLTAICAHSEADFLDLGSRLQTIQLEAQQLTRAIFTVLSEADDHSLQGALKAIQQHAGGAMQEIDQRRGQLSDDLVGLQATRADLGALGEQNGQFKQVAKNLKMVGLTISIEAARTPAATAAFQSLAEEISELARTVHTVTRQIGDDTHAAQQGLAAIHEQIGTRMRDLDGLMNSARAAVHTALEQVDNLMQTTLCALDRIGVQSRRIAEQVGHLVVGVQIHDNISQRAAHIHDSLCEAADLVRGAAGRDADEGQAAALGRAYGINRLQLAQLQTIADDVRNVQQQCASALDTLLATVAAVARPEGLEIADPGGAHSVNVLTGALEHLMALFDEGLDHIQRLAAAREQTKRTIARMNSHIDQVGDINFDIHLKALNAVIRSIRLGNAGRAIAAIVTEMKALAEQSNTTIGAVAGVMERIAAASQVMDARKEIAQAEGGTAGMHLRNGIADFADACVALRQHSEEALQMGGRIEAQIAQSRSHIDFFEQMLADCRLHQEQLGEINVLLQPYADAAPEEWIAEERKIIERYTMDREREAHLGMIDAELFADGGQTTPPMPFNSATGPLAASEEAEFDDNVELF
jgi:chromosome segregation ATPase